MHKKALIGAVALSVTALLGGLGLGLGVATADTAPGPNPPVAPAPEAAPRVSAYGSSPAKYTGVTPCRIVDTRATSPLAVGDVRNFYVSGTTGFAPQGGKSGGCGIPAYATSVTVTLTATQATGKGYLRAYASGGAAPTATSLNYSKLADFSVGATLPLGSGGKLATLAFGATTDLVVDVTGFYEPPIAGIYSSAGVPQSQSRLSMSKGAVGKYILTADRDVTNCAINASSWTSYQGAAYGSGNKIYVETSNAAGAALDVYFQVSVTC